MTQTGLRQWYTDREDICSEIASRKSALKILLKTRDEPELLSGWVEHHARIAGAENLIIADNGSTMPESKELLQRLSETCTVFQFVGFHNEIHRQAAFPDLYAAMTEAAPVFIPADTDERLYWIEGDTWIADHRLAEKICARLPFDLLPSALVGNTPGKLNSFNSSKSAMVRKNALTWGKPAVSTRFDFEGHPRLHNCQFQASSEMPSGDLHLFHLHLTAVNPEWRLRANVQKLIARNILSEDASREEIEHFAETTETDNVTVGRFAHEMRRIIRHMKDPSQPYWPKTPTADIVELAEGGKIQFGSPAARDALQMMIRGGADFVWSEVLHP